MLKPLTLASLLLASVVHAAPSAVAVDTAKYAVATYRQPMIASLAKMVSFNTVADPKIAYADNPQHTGFKQYLKEEAARLGFDYADYGWVMVIGLGNSSERVGIITHGDVQPVDPTKWKKSPFELDATSEPGRLLARGSEDDKGPIATALYAMKAIKERKVALSKRLELYVYMGEESDWEPLIAFLKTHEPPQMNITLDAEYPVVAAEKGWSAIELTVPKQPAVAAGVAQIGEFAGGFFGSQIPEDAHATALNADAALEAKIRARAAQQRGMHYQFSRQDGSLAITARGVSAHSSKPEDGVNAIAMLADALKVQTWPETSAGAMVNLLNELIGTTLYGEQFGKIAYRDSFMGPMSVSPTVIKAGENGLSLNINMRRPQGKSGEQLKEEINAALGAWQAKHVALADVKLTVTDPWVQKDAPQIPVLLSVFSHFTGIKNPTPISIGGGTNSRLFPHAVSFGPAMPNTVYTGHSEHEFISVKQLMLNLQMYTAVMVELAK